MARGAGEQDCVEGPPGAVDNARGTLPEPLRVQLLPDAGTQAVNLVERVGELEVIEATGVGVLGTDPRLVAVDVDEIRVIQAQIRSRLPATLRVDELSFDPPGEDDAGVPGGAGGNTRLPDPSIVDELEPGVRHTVRARLTPRPGCPPRTSS